MNFFVSKLKDVSYRVLSTVLPAMQQTIPFLDDTRKKKQGKDHEAEETFTFGRCMAG